MLVYIESFYGDKLISGKKCTVKELEEMMQIVLGLIERTEDFTPLFCRSFKFEEYPMQEDIDYDYEFTIDLDVHKVF